MLYSIAACLPACALKLGIDETLRSVHWWLAHDITIVSLPLLGFLMGARPTATATVTGVSPLPFPSLPDGARRRTKCVACFPASLPNGIFCRVTRRARAARAARRGVGWAAGRTRGRHVRERRGRDGVRANVLSVILMARLT